MRLIYVMLLGTLMLAGCSSKVEPGPTATASASISQGDQFLQAAKQASSQKQAVEAETNAELAVAYFKANGPQASLIVSLELAAQLAEGGHKPDRAGKYYQELVRLVPAQPRYRKALNSLQVAVQKEKASNSLVLAEKALGDRHFQEAQAYAEESVKGFKASHDETGLKRAHQILARAQSGAGAHLERSKSHTPAAGDAGETTSDQQQTLHDAAHRASRYHN